MQPHSLPTRKQNVACDACRTRKVRCVMTSGTQEKCQHCQSKGYPCTFNVQRETTEKRKQGSSRKKLWGNNNNNPDSQNNNAAVKYDIVNTPATTTDTSIFSPPPTGEHRSSSLEPFYPSTNANTNIFPPIVSCPTTSTTPTSSSDAIPQNPFNASLQMETSTSRLLTYLFSPEQYSPSYKSVIGHYKSLPDYVQCHQPVPAEDWGEIGTRLCDPSFRREFALDLVQVYFEIVHARIAVITPTRFRNQLHAALTPSVSSQPLLNHASDTSSHNPSLHPQSSSSHPNDTPNPAILAAVLAWGAKFSEHPLIVQDRNADTTTGKRRSRLAASLRNKAFEIAEAEKAHTVPSPDAIIIGLLLDGLSSHIVDAPDGYRGFWLSCAVRHLLHLKINNRFADHSLITPEYRQTLTYAWWLSCLADSFSAVYFRRKPLLEDDDYNVDLYPQDLNEIAQSITSGSHEQLAVVKRQEFLAWYTASHELARCAREMSRQLWRPVVETEGVSHHLIRRLMHSIYKWQTEHLNKVGVPSSQVNWDFLAAVNACGHDALYHTLWVILYQAIQEFGIREVKEMKHSPDEEPHSQAQYATTESQVRKEALNSASRIAGLADLLTQSGYLRLDPNIMHFNVYNAGKLLAQFGREEVMMCIRGLQQYGLAYEEAFDQADELQQIYNHARSISSIDRECLLSIQSVDGVSNESQIYNLTDNTVHLIRAPP